MRNIFGTAVVLEALDARLAIARLAVEVLVGHVRGVEPIPHDGEHARELREDERLVALDDVTSSRSATSASSFALVSPRAE